MALHPQMQEMLDRRRSANIPPFAAGTPDTARSVFAAAQEALPKDRGASVREMRDETIAGPAGPVQVRRYVPDVADTRGCIVYLHGGGWTFGTLDAFDPVCRELADASGCEVVSVDYRLSPENPFPAPLDDAWQVLVAMAEPGKPIVVAGDSAGGHLAASLALRARDEGGPEIAAQVLCYPVIDPACDSVSYDNYGGGDYLISRADMAWFWGNFCPAAQREHADLSAIEDFSGLPPAIVVLAGCDPLHHEGAAYAAALSRGGVPVTVRDHPDMGHGFFTLVDLLDRANSEVREVGGLVAGLLAGD